MQLETTYKAGSIESKWYAHWEKSGYFKSTPDRREPFTIVMPPPNVTGVLHMGHMLNNTVQDILIRDARLRGKNACWVPGTDHASIATEAKVTQMLRERGIKKSEIGREEFLKYAFEWKEKYGSVILEQLRKLGASCDWDRTAFTMDEIRSKAVIQCFVDLYRKGKLYRKKRMINWDPEAQTVLSNEEVIYAEEQSQLFYIHYALENGHPGEGIVIATQRPETIMADTAVAVHPDDPRYKPLHGKRVKIPLINKYIPVIADDYIDKEFGTGALKVTPAHDHNDYEIGLRHKLDIVDILNPDGTLNAEAQILVGMDRFAARKKIKALLEEAGVLVKTEDYRTNIGRSERTQSVVEPRLSLQWYVDMKALAQPAIDAVMQGRIAFLPEHMKNTYHHWMENIRDWCISRQLWWGHRIPAYYYQGDVFVAATAEEALRMAKAKTGIETLQVHQLQQDEDVLDTWFSSWLWPISVFDGFRSKDEMAYYYPTHVLVTGWDIIFLWVARMIMAGYEWTNAKPFHEVYFTGMVRDKMRRKMSKSLGNSPDALKLIEDYGADGVRFGMLSCSPAGGDLLFDEKLCEQGRNFANKLWNAMRLIKLWHSDPSAALAAGDRLVMDWATSCFDQVFSQVRQLFAQRKLSECLMAIYSFAWDDFCSFYLEAIKPKQGYGINDTVLAETIRLMEKLCQLLHPFMPFITEEIWHGIKPRAEGEDCIVSTYPTPAAVDQALLDHMSELRHVISSIREIRQKNQLKMSTPLTLRVIDNDPRNLLARPGCVDLLKKMANLSTVETTATEIPNAVSFVGLRNKYFVTMPGKINAQEEIKKLETEIDYTLGFLESVEKKLNNEKFMANAKAEIIQKEIQKKRDAELRLASLKNSLLKLKGM